MILIVNKIKYLLISRSIWWIVFAAIILRLSFVLLFPQEPINKSDALRYVVSARNIVNDSGFISSSSRLFHCAPIYPLFLSAIFTFIGENLVIIRILQAIISGLNVYLFYLIGRKAYGKKVGGIALIVGCFYPYFIYYSGLILTETVTIFLLSLSVYLLVKLTDKKKVGLFFLTGIVFGISALSKSVIFYLIPVFFLFLLYVAFQKGRLDLNLCSKLAVALMGVLIAMAPWIYRNYALSGQIIPVTKDAGLMFYSQAGRLLDPKDDYPLSITYEHNPYLENHRDDFMNDKIQFELEIDSYYLEKTKTLIKAYPWEYVKDSWFRFKRFWAFYPTQYADEKNTLYFIIGILSFGIFFPFFILGLFRSFYENWLYTVLFIGIILYFSIIHSLILGMIRYRLPIEPYIILLGSCGLNVVWQKRKDYIKRIE